MMFSLNIYFRILFFAFFVISIATSDRDQLLIAISQEDFQCCMLYRSSHRRCSVRKGVVKNFAKFTGKHLCQSLFINKLQAKPFNFINKETQAQVFSCELCEISKNSFSYRTPPVAVSGYSQFYYTSSSFYQNLYDIK